MSHRCFVKIYTKEPVQESSEVAAGLSDSFSKHMDAFIATLPDQILERRDSLHLHEDMDKDKNIFVLLDRGHSSSRMPHILLEVVIELTNNVKKKRTKTENILKEIVENHFEPMGIPNFTVEVFVMNRS